MRHPRPKRAAFTLVELLVVILIIAILVSLVSSAVMMALGQVSKVRTASEISQLTVAVNAFMTDRDLTTPPPSQLLLYENIGSYKTDLSPLAAQTYLFLQKAFSRSIGMGSPYVDWNGNGAPDVLPWYLEGEQCLVFYCGGIPAIGGPPTGFSANKLNPAAIGGKRLGPYYDFQVARLALLPGLSPFPVYIDSWESKTTRKPYAYFSSQGNYNGYANLGNSYLLTDCAAIGASPYAQSYTAGTIDPAINKVVTYLSPTGFQIISAGKDGVFAQCRDSAGLWGQIPAAWASSSGGPFLPVPPAPPFNVNSSNIAAMNDDQSNFTTGVMGVNQQ